MVALDRLPVRSCICIRLFADRAGFASTVLYCTALHCECVGMDYTDKITKLVVILWLFPRIDTTTFISQKSSYYSVQMVRWKLWNPSSDIHGIVLSTGLPSWYYVVQYIVGFTFICAVLGVSGSPVNEYPSLQRTSFLNSALISASGTFLKDSTTHRLSSCNWSKATDTL
jgi:hypothetical protein